MQNIKIKIELQKCNAAFVFTCKNLSRKLLEKYMIEDNSRKGLWEVQDKTNNGYLNNKWNFQFHGNQCCFENNITKQKVEVDIPFYPDFKHVDYYFLYEFLRTTSKFKHLEKVVDYNYSRIFEIIK